MAYSIGRSGWDSRCCQPADPPWQWIDYTDYAHAEISELEAWLGTLTPPMRDHELGRMDNLLERAEQGKLEDSGDETTPIAPIRHDPEIYELRHQALSKKMRLYHGEPLELPMALVALHRHIKVNDEHQQQQIEHAAERYNDGRDSLWNND
ncbi:hypothetical protein [Microbacterium oxydans]|uniref:hypothetical protein n=1 Tax=Microbacterium oxydans TaxID=82380 RepID=UPI001FA7272D|nr:hypothetical protein [Microbacterium oxydans]